MKCPECGEALNEGHVCKSCGRDVKGSAEEFEVEYKEFKLSEFLEIRRKREKKSLKDYSKRENNVQKASVDKKKALFKYGKDIDSIKNKKNKKVFVIFLVSIIGLVLISGLILFVRDFF